MKDKKIYRSKAVESFHSRDEFQQALRIITPKSWIFLIIFFLLFIMGFLWLVFGKVTTLVQGQGIIFAKNAEIINVMSPISGGYIKQLLVSPGEKVKKGQVIAKLVNPNIASEAKELKKYIAEQKIKLNELSTTAKKEIDIRTKQIEESVKFTHDENVNLQEKMTNLGLLLKTHEEAFKKGILSRLELANVQIAYYDAKGQISKNQNTLVELNQNKNDYIESWNTKIRDIQEKLAQSEYNLQKLEENIELIETVSSPVNGIIANNYAKQGDFLTEKQTLSNIMTYSDELEVIAFFNDDISKKITIGMPAKVFPKHINAMEYGGIIGKVTYISELPIPPQSLQSLIENQKQVDKIFQNGPVFKVVIELVRSPDTATGYLWTTSEGPSEKISVGSVVDVGVVIKKERPLGIIMNVAQSAKNWVMNKNE